MKKKLFPFLLCAVLVLSIGVVACAAIDYTMTYYPDADDVTNMPQNDYGTGGAAYTVSSTVPQRSGYEFIDWTLDYAGKTYTVTYVVNPDQTWVTPEGSTVPHDSTLYPPNAYVHVASQLTTTKDYAYNEKGEKVLGTWTFTPWDKADFEITEDTTITGGWSFEPAPAKTYHYTVYYKLYEGNPDGGTEVNKPTSGDVPPFTIVPIDAIPVKKLNNPYRSEYNYEIRHGFEHVSVQITHDNYEITIWYQIKSHGM